ncbi:MAG TPA: phosphoglycerate kinase [Terriglobia bacterium]|jgi:phosphoglycerate kinase|nr:phosphoglycerate kinase [Terriglobia bacterium]
MNKLSIRDLDLKGKRVFIRVDFNVPLDEEGRITNDARIQASLPTIRHALSQNGRVILASHLGRPKGKVNPKMSLKPVAAALGRLLGRNVLMASDCVGEEALAQSRRLKEGDVLMLENLRFHSQEEANDPEFAKQLAALCELYVNDAFGTAHRAHASTVGMIPFVGKAAAGLLMEKELAYLGKAVSNPDRPYLAIIGGAKVSDKIQVIDNLLNLVDVLLIGGGMAYTFLVAEEYEVGKSLVETDKIALAESLLNTARDRKVTLLLPVDHVVASKLSPTAEIKTTTIQETPMEWMGLDIGPETVARFRNQIALARTILWNGPLGVFEMEPFAQGTMAIAQAVAECSATTIIGGGDSIAAVTQAGVADKITHISTGGGASLEFLGGAKLPGVEALSDK